MENKSEIVTDALPLYLTSDLNKNTCQTPLALLTELIRDFTLPDYKSAFFLLMDYIGKENYFNLIRKEKQFLMQEFIRLCRRFNDSDVLIELFGTMKRYKKLRLLDKCGCVYKKVHDREFNKINDKWKMLYSLCEELTETDLMNLKEKVPNSSRDLIKTAEDYFCWVLTIKNSEADLYNFLKIIFSTYPKCLKILEEFQVKHTFYNVKKPTVVSPCGIAVIFNFEKFNEETNLRYRKGSSVDSENLRKLWEDFGFKTDVYPNLTYEETFEKLEYYAKLDHSNYDLFICCILSHGKSNSVYASDGREMPIPHLIAIITNHCPSLNQKPKLFFINACQGEYIIEDLGKPILPVSMNNIPDESNEKFISSLPPMKSHTLKVISSIDGFVSFRHAERGSWFIQALCKVMNEYGDRRSILDVMIEVNKEVQKHSGPEKFLQIAECSNTFVKTLILKKVVQVQN